VLSEDPDNLNSGVASADFTIVVNDRLAPFLMVSLNADQITARTYSEHRIRRLHVMWRAIDSGTASPMGVQCDSANKSLRMSQQ
jgi:hypothetical protein